MESDGAARERRFTDLYEGHYGSVYAFAARRVGRERADEVAAETFLIAWRKFGAVPPTPLPWLYGVARNVIARLGVAAAREGQALQAIVNELAAAHQPSSDTELDQSLPQAWERLSDRDREVLALVSWEELSVGEAAVVLQCPAPVFSVRLHRARGRFAKFLAESEQKPALLSEVAS